MGIVRKQSILSLISVYAGFIIGAINTYLYLHLLSQTEYGLTGILREVFVAFGIFATLGSTLTFHRFFPLYAHNLKNKDNDFPLIILGVCLLGSILVLGGFIGFKPQIVAHFSKNAPLFAERFYLLIPLTLSFTTLILFEAYATMLKRTVSFNLVKELGFRLFQTLIIFPYVWGWINSQTFFVLFSLMYIPSLLLMAKIVFGNDGIRFKFKISKLTKKVYKKLLNFASYHFLGILVAVAPTAFNSLLIGSTSENGLRDVAVYTLAKFMISVMDAPIRSMSGINIAMISDAFHRKDIPKVASIYQKSSINLFVIGIGLFIIIYFGIDLVPYVFKDKDYSSLKYMFFILGIGKLLELSMGMNNTIMYLSKFWKTDFYTSLVVIVISIPLNYFLIKNNPLMGAAIGETIMLSLYCLLRFFWLKKLLNIQPYTFKILGILLFGIASFILLFFLPHFQNVFIDTGIKIMFFGMFYLTFIWYYKPSIELHDLLEKIVNKVKRK